MGIFLSIKRHYYNKTLVKELTKRASMPFIIIPKEIQQKNGSYTLSHLHKGEDYHDNFVKMPGRKMVWDLEQVVLNEIITNKGPFKFYLDFAGGTGRIAKVFEPHTDHLIVLDISQQMLSVAAKALTKATLINRDFREGLPEQKDESLDIATAFRFFSNAEYRLKSEAMAFLFRKLKKGGWLICNNHRNFWSIPYIVNRLSLLGGDFGMTNHQLLSIAYMHGFRLVKTFSMGLLPQSENRALLPWKIVRPIEYFLFKSIGEKQLLGYNVIFIFERAKR